MAYCNTDNKIFNTNPLDDPSCYRIANNKCLTASSDADKNVCNQYYINIIILISFEYYYYYFNRLKWRQYQVKLYLQAFLTLLLHL